MNLTEEQIIQSAINRGVRKMIIILILISIIIAILGSMGNFKLTIIIFGVCIGLSIPSIYMGKLLITNIFKNMRNDEKQRVIEKEIQKLTK